MNISNKQSGTVDNGCSSAWGLDKGLTTPHNKRPACYKVSHTRSLTWTHSLELSRQGKWIQNSVCGMLGVYREGLLKTVASKYFREIGSKGVDWIHVAQNMDQW
jgi:hypothetical protein